MGREVLIAGLGLIGGSIGKSLRAAGWRVGFVDPSVSLDEAKKAEAADEKREQLNGDFIVLATPVNVAIAQLRGLKTFATSTCSVMQSMRDVATAEFVAGHPFAGSERRGLAAADASLFRGKPWFVDRDHPIVRQMIEDCGATQVIIDPKKHDEVLALTSHLPQVIATALASLLHDIDPMFIGTGAQSMLRLAGSSYDVWCPILEANAPNIGTVIDDLAARMHTLDGDDFVRANALVNALRESAARRER